MLRFPNQLLMIGFSLFANICFANNSDCLTTTFTECIDSVIATKLETENKTNIEDKLRIRTSLAAGKTRNDLFEVPDVFYKYRKALINVHPKETRKYKTEIVAFIIKQNIEMQTKLLTSLALIEAYSGDTTTAKKSINHAIRNSPNNHRSRIAAHLVDQTADYIEQTIKQVGYQLSICNSPDLQVVNSLKLAVSKDQTKFSQTINSIPDEELKISILLLTASYLSKVNHCQFQTDLFEKQIISIIENSGPLLESIVLGQKTINTYHKLN